MTAEETSNRSVGVSITGGYVMTGGGDIVGGNKVQVITAPALDQAFSPLALAIDAVPASDRPDALTALATLKSEAAKGKDADDGVVAELVKGLAKLVPAGIGAIGHAFGTPILDGLAGPLTRQVLDALLGR